MLPIRLELKNFLAYRNPDSIYFEGIHLACLSGPNGAGKSSILDAVTWAIWGKARARSDDELIHIGQEEMVVTLDFVQHETLYRIMRRRRLGNKRKSGGRSPGTTMLDLFGWVEDENTFRIISEPSIRQTQDKIKQLIGLDYDTFANSAYLQQGRADAFTVQAPAHRKRILAEILNLNLWGIYEDRTKARLREINNSLTVIATQMQEAEEEIAQEPVVRQEFELAEEQLEQARELVAQAEARFREMAGAETELQAAESELRQAQYQINERQREIGGVEDQIAHYRQRLADYQAVIDQRETIEDGYNKLVEARDADQELGNKLRELLDVEGEIQRIKQQIAGVQQQIEHEIVSSETLIDEATRQGEVGAVLQAQIDDMRQEIGLLEQDEARSATLEQEISDLKSEMVGLKAENDTLRPEMDAIKHRLEMVEQSTEANCPLCGQSLDDEHRENLIEEFYQEGTTRGDRFRANKARVEVIQEEMEEREQTRRILAPNLPKLTPLRGQLGSLEHQYREAEAALHRVSELQTHVHQLQATIADKDFAHELHQSLAEIEQRRDSLGYDSQAHDEIREMMEEYKTYQEQSTQLEIALKSLPEIEQSLEEALARESRWRKALAELEERATKIETQLVEIRVRVDEMHRRESEMQQQRTQERQAMEKRTALRQKLHAIDDMRRRYEQLQQRQSDMQEEQVVYQQLKNAFSKNGIPAMIIEAAIPELEAATNRLLAKMTEGRLTVRFDTQREKKTGGVAETFDIWIGDEVGTRDYMLYSGGEAFRINFAIRVAISQLLARRAGAQLRTLFLDEGFGTQDNVGRERLVEAINAIQDDFDLILVITHIDELRDAFPVRIEVEKLADGSRVRVI